jgi:hypothetical protein
MPMKRNMILKVSVLSILLLFSLSGCKKKGASVRSEKENGLVNTLNQAWVSLGWKIQAEQVTTSVEPPSPQGGLPLTRVTLSNPSLFFDTAKLNDFSTGIRFNDKQIAIKMKEMVFRYNARNQYLQLLSCKGLVLAWNYTKVAVKGEKPAAISLKLTAANITFKEYDISPLLKITDQDVLGAMTRLITQNQVMNSRVENVYLERHFSDDNSKPMVVTVTCGLAQISQHINADVFTWLYSPREDAVLPDFSKLSRQGKAVYDDRFTGKDIKASVWKERTLLASGAMADVMITYYLKPSDCKNYFDYGIQTHIHGVKIASTTFPWLEKIGDVQELGANVSFVNLTPDFTQACYEMINKTETLDRTAGKEEAAKYQMSMCLKAFTELVKSEPKLKFEISPLKNALCNVDIKGNFRFFQLSIPVGKAIIKIKDMKALLATLKKESIQPIEMVHAILTFLEQSVVIDNAGNGTVIVETKEDFPGQFFLNGKPVRK